MHPLRWYIAGPLIGLVVPALLLLGVPVMVIAIVSALAGTWTYRYLRARLPH